MNRINLLLFGTILFGLVSCQEKSNEEIKWNFKNFEKLTYDYQQIVENSSPFETNEKMYNKVRGVLIVSVKDNDKADIVFKDLKVSIFSISPLILS